MIGIDIDNVERFNESILKKIALQNEVEYIEKTNCESLRQQRIASLFCVKEAVMKALGLGKDSGVSFKNINLIHNKNGQPFVELSGVALEQKEKLYPNKSLHISLSHTINTVVAVAVIL